MDWRRVRGVGAADRLVGARAITRTIRSRPVRAPLEPGRRLRALPEAPPEAPEAMEAIFADFERIVMPGMTHWQHPRFFAYFPANAAPASMLAEFLTTTLAAQCMLWQTSPAATELETRMLDWLRQALGLPAAFAGVIQDSASSATLAAVLAMRERATGWQGNETGLGAQPRLRIYASAEVHSSVERAVWVAGIGRDNLVRVPTAGPLRAMDADALRRLVAEDARRPGSCRPGSSPAPAAPAPAPATTSPRWRPWRARRTSTCMSTRPGRARR